MAQRGFEGPTPLPTHARCSSGSSRNSVGNKSKAGEKNRHSRNRRMSTVPRIGNEYNLNLDETKNLLPPPAVHYQHYQFNQTQNPSINNNNIRQFGSRSTPTSRRGSSSVSSFTSTIPSLQHAASYSTMLSYDSGFASGSFPNEEDEEEDKEKEEPEDQDFTEIFFQELNRSLEVQDPFYGYDFGMGSSGYYSSSQASINGNDKSDLGIRKRIVRRLSNATSTVLSKLRSDQEEREEVVEQQLQGDQGPRQQRRHSKIFTLR